jgi:valyl-tRNA synthetase
VRIIPGRFEKVFFHWLENIRDWNVSRQLWWGHRIPAWYCPDGHFTVSDRLEGPSACGTCGRPAPELTQDPDIFDTWFSSGLWPFSTLGWPERTSDLGRYYPGTVMETGYDIIFFWVARMMMLGEWLLGEAPFEVVSLSGLVKDPYGAKMSKTKGNVVDPLATIGELGADALRFALVHAIAPGADVKLGPAKLDGARNFGNKLWNAARFVIGARPDEVPEGGLLELPSVADLGPAERWILGRCAATIEAVTASHEAYQLGEVTRLLYDAVWSEYCDWYLELAKARLSGADASPAERAATWRVLAWVLERYVRLLHPVMPFVTEAIWGHLPHEAGDPELLIVADWPTAEREAALADAATGAAVEALLELVSATRNARAEAGLDASTWLEADLVLPDHLVRETWAALAEPLGRLARLRPVRWHARAADLPASTAGGLAVITPAGEAHISRGGADPGLERARLERELADAQRQLAAAEARLADPAFASRAPAPIVEGARTRAAELRALIARLGERLGG